jgi:hypothetical protein
VLNSCAISSRKITPRQARCCFSAVKIPLVEKFKRVVVDEKRTLQLPEIPLLIKIYRKRSMGWLIALGEPIFNKPVKPKEPANSEPYYDYVI